MSDETNDDGAVTPPPGGPSFTAEPVGFSAPPPPPPGLAVPPIAQVPATQGPAGAAAPPPPPPPAAAPLPPPPPVVTVAATTRWRSLRGLTTALTVLLWLAAADAVFAIVAFGNRINVTNDLLDNQFDFGIIKRASDADDLVSAAAGIMAFLSFVIFVLIIIWTYRAMKNNEALGRQYPRFKAGWGIAGWLIPFANAVIPVLILQDLWRGSEATSPRGDPSWRANKGSALVGWYWGLFLLSSARFGVSGADENDPSRTYLRDLRTRDSTAVVGMMASIAAAILAIQVIRRIASRQEECLRAQQTAWSAQAGPATTPA